MLPGIGRETVLSIAGDKGIPIRTGRFKTEDLDNAEEIFLTNSVRGVVPVCRWEEQEYKEGETTRRIILAWQQEIENYLQTN